VKPLWQVLKSVKENSDDVVHHVEKRPRVWGSESFFEKSHVHDDRERSEVQENETFEILNDDVIQVDQKRSKILMNLFESFEAFEDEIVHCDGVSKTAGFPLQRQRSR
jgi:hypothetical protein